MLVVCAFAQDFEPDDLTAEIIMQMAVYAGFPAARRVRGGIGGGAHLRYL